jgi:phosphate starvation-inducible PhoH-like protein
MTKMHSLYETALRDKPMMPVIAYGSAGTGKTFGAVSAAVEWLERDKKSQVLVTRPNVSFAQGNGFLPGTEREKMEPWIRPIQQNLSLNGCDAGKQQVLEKRGRLTYMPLEFIQGLTFDNTFIIVDECQNMTFDQLKVFLTRTGKYSKVVLCGDVAQISPRFKGSGLGELVKMINEFNMPVHTLEFTREDILRSDQCRMWITHFEDWEYNKHNGKVVYV